MLSQLPSSLCQANHPYEGYTTVQGPPNGELFPIQVDLNEMTDTFMTAGVLMARASECSHRRSQNSAQYFSRMDEINRISGIANQRVKECNRIEAMVDNLSR